MKAQHQDPRIALDRAIHAVRSDEPSPTALAASRARLEARLFSEAAPLADDAPIRGCADVQSLLSVYRRGGLPAPRALLVRSHLSECADCREVFGRRGALRLATTPWQRSAEPRLAPRRQSTRTYALLAAAAVLCVALLAVRSVFFGLPAGPRATVELVSGVLYRIEGGRATRLAPGATLDEGQAIRAGSSPQSVVRLGDGSRVELGARAEFSVAMRGQDTTLHLSRGQVIVQAAKRQSGHLDVVTHDCRVAVTGTVFSVLASLKGSRVSVIEGEVHVAQSVGAQRAGAQTVGAKNVLHRGDQVSTNPSLATIPIEEEVAWSRNLDVYLALLHEMTELRRQWDAVRQPALRYATRLLPLVPDVTVVYAALPNYGQTLDEGYRILKARLAESAVLRAWWESTEMGQQSAQVDELIATLRGVSGFLGDEVVIAGSLQTDAPEVIVLSEVKRPGLREAVGSELPVPGGPALPVTVVDEEDVSRGALSGVRPEGAVLLVTPQVAAISLAPAAIAEVVARVQSGEPSAFASLPIGERVAEAYEKGVGLLVAADLEMLPSPGENTDDAADAGGRPRYLLFEHKDVLDQPLNSGELVFAGPRSGVASWLGEPAPMGSLDFLTPQASAVAAFVVKRPAEVLDDVLRSSPRGQAALSKLLGFDPDSALRLREDLTESLGAEVAFALDGPLLPVPAWKLVIEALDAERLESALEALVARADQELERRGLGALVFEHEQAGDTVYHSIRTREAGLPIEAHYAFIDGYWVVTPSRALLSRAIQAHARGESLAVSRRFTSLLPRDGRAAVSGLIFQDLIGVVAAALEPANGILSSGQRQSLEQLLRESKPSMVGFYGGEDRIEMAGVGSLFPIGPEALALPGLMRHTFPRASGAFWE